MLIAVLAIVVFAAGWLTGRMGIGSVVDPASLTEAERQFAERMRNVSMVGTFTVWGREERAPRTDHYAGTWQNPKVGGFMSGRIERAAPAYGCARAPRRPTSRPRPALARSHRRATRPQAGDCEASSKSE